MKIDIFPKNPHDLYTTPLLQQTAYWSEVKSKLGFIPLAFEIEVREKDENPKFNKMTLLYNAVRYGNYQPSADDLKRMKEE